MNGDAYLPQALGQPANLAQSDLGLEAPVRVEAANQGQ
jgi:hypothetical protein